MAKKAKKHYTHRVTESLSPIRISDYCGPVFPILGSKSAVKKAIAAGRLFLNGKVAKTADFVRQGDLIELQGSGIREVKKYDLDLEIVHEDDDLVVVNKPGGIAVNGNRYKTVENALVGAVQVGKQIDALPRPVAVHRIDVPTKGLVILAKTKTALTELGKAFQANEVKKEYVAVVHGQIPPDGRIEQAIDGKAATTEYERLEVAPSRNFHFLSMVRLMPITGRTHQLRIHLREAGHLIVGDKAYAQGQKTILGKGLFLSSCRLQFVHPKTAKIMDLQIDPPA